MIYDFIILLIGWLYPVLGTYNSLTVDSREQVIWMKYWIVFGFYNAIFFFTGCLPSWFPILKGFKMLTLCWILPSFGDGYQLIHDGLLDPLLKCKKQTIHRIINTLSKMGNWVLRELVKMLYHVLVEVADHCWQITRNSDDICVTPRLQVAINEVLAELRVARCSLHRNRNCPPQQRAESTAAKAIPFDNRQLRIQLAEAVYGQRMQLIRQLASQEHLAHIKCSLKMSNPVPPSIIKPDAAEDSQLVVEL